MRAELRVSRGVGSGGAQSYTRVRGPGLHLQPRAVGSAYGTDRLADREWPEEGL